MSRRASGPGVLDALSLLTEVTDELVLRGVRDTHDAWADRFGGYPGRAITSAVYAGVGLGLRAAATGLDRAGAAGIGPRLDQGPRGRFVRSAVNGLIGDSLAVERPRLAITMAVRIDGRDVPLTPEGLAAAFPGATGRVVVLHHGLCENESYWDRGRERVGTTYAETLVDLGWTPVLLRSNTGLTVRENGAALTSLMDRLVAAWPVPVTQVALVGHSMGGLIVRAAGAVASDHPRPWTELVSDVITLGTPHLGAPIARGIGHGARGLARLPETAAFGRILDRRSVGVHDLVDGLAEDVPPLPHARYRLVAATLTERERHPVGHVVGDLLVRPPSAYGRDRRGGELFPGADVLHLGRTDHFGLLNHPDVHQALREWLSS
jgi:pimeloyl-ACP methyl ester carboxylesterase